MTVTYIVSGNRFRVVSEGGSVHYTSKSEIEASIVRVIRSDAFAARGVDGLTESTRQTLAEWSNALRLMDTAKAPE